jgi:hypothetical protein
MEPSDPNILDLDHLPLEEPEAGIVDAYANVINYNWTLTDVRLRFAELLHVPNPDSPNWTNQDKVIMEKVSVTIPWYQAKLMRDMLNKIVGAYEAVNGELKQPKLADIPKEK